MGLSGLTVNKHLVIFFGKMDGVDALTVTGGFRVSRAAWISHAGRQGQRTGTGAGVRLRERRCRHPDGS